MQITSDIELSGAGCTTAITPNQLVQSSSENDSGYLAEIEITSIDDGRTEWLVLPGQPPCESPAAALSLAEAALYRVRGFDARGRPLFSD
ncbi:hypothetical protein JTL44_31850 [Pseudomonas aeruginosa]|nr:hypothetical protein [Pseudomonas aeruginosa]MBN0458657.1 hypothetical protein [Pseudomonas aeruginosa]